MVARRRSACRRGSHSAFGTPRTCPQSLGDVADEHPSREPRAPGQVPGRCRVAPAGARWPMSDVRPAGALAAERRPAVVAYLAGAPRSGSTHRPGAGSTRSSTRASPNSPSTPTSALAPTAPGGRQDRGALRQPLRGPLAPCPRRRHTSLVSSRSRREQGHPNHGAAQGQASRKLNVTRLGASAPASRRANEPCVSVSRGVQRKAADVTFGTAAKRSSTLDT